MVLTNSFGLLGGIGSIFGSLDLLGPPKALELIFPKTDYNSKTSHSIPAYQIPLLVVG